MCDYDTGQGGKMCREPETTPFRDLACGICQLSRNKKTQYAALLKETKHRIFTSVTLLMLLLNPDQRAAGHYYRKERG